MSVREDMSMTSHHCFRSDHATWSEVMRARNAADLKHSEQSIERIAADDPRWLSILVEEIGEVAHALTYDSGATADELRAELIDVLSVAGAWVAALNERGA